MTSWTETQISKLPDTSSCRSRPLWARGPPKISLCLRSLEHFQGARFSVSYLWSVTICHCLLIGSPLWFIRKAHSSMRTLERSNDAKESMTGCLVQPMKYRGHSEEMVPPPFLTTFAAFTKLANIFKECCLLASNCLMYLAPFLLQLMCCHEHHTVQGSLACKQYPGFFSIYLTNDSICLGSYKFVTSLKSLTHLLPWSSATSPMALFGEQQNS